MHIALIKPVVLAIKTYILVMALSPPMSSAQEGERYEPRGLKYGVVQIIRAFRPFTKLLFAFDSVIESVCILAATYPSELSSRTLELLAFSSNKSASTFDPSFLWLIGMVIAIGGGILRVAAFRALGDIWTSEPAVLKEHKLITTGPYAVSRHPAYTGLLGLMWGSTIALISPGSWTREILGRYVMASQDSWAMWTRLLALVMFGGQPIVVIAIAMTTREEEALLKRSFGKQWDKWARDTPWQIVPGVY